MIGVVDAMQGSDCSVSVPGVEFVSCQDASRVDLENRPSDRIVDLNDLNVHCRYAPMRLAKEQIEFRPRGDFGVRARGVKALGFRFPQGEVER